MQKLNVKELKNVKGGASAGWIIAGIVAGITFFVGVLDGYSRPFKCR